MSHSFQQGLSKLAEPDDNGYPSTLDVGHLETVVRVLAMLARTGCSSFKERLNILMQVGARKRIVDVVMSRIRSF